MKTPSSIMGLVKNREVTRMNKEANKDLKTLFFAGMVGLFLVIGIAGKATGVPVTTIYEFVPEQGSLGVSGGFAGTSKAYPVEGQFQLTIDFAASTASFDWVDAAISEPIWYHHEIWEPPRLTQDLNIILHMTELVSTYVSDTQIDFLLERNDPMYPDPRWDIRIRLIFMDDLLHLTGGFSEPMHDSYQYDLDAVAVYVPEPLTLLFLGLGGLIIRRQICRKRTT